MSVGLLNSRATKAFFNALCNLISLHSASSESVVSAAGCWWTYHQILALTRLPLLPPHLLRLSLLDQSRRIREILLLPLLMPRPPPLHLQIPRQAWERPLSSCPYLSSASCLVRQRYPPRQILLAISSAQLWNEAVSLPRI